MQTKKQEKPNQKRNKDLTCQIGESLINTQVLMQLNKKMRESKYIWPACLNGGAEIDERSLLAV
jgi:hypothetical protein